MAGSKVLKFVLLISFVNIATHALRVLLTDGRARPNGIYHKTPINFAYDEFGSKIYAGCFIDRTITVGDAITKVVVFIKTYSELLNTTLLYKWSNKRKDIRQEFFENFYELFYLGVQDFTQSDQHLVAKFLLEVFQAKHPHFKVETIGQGITNLNYTTGLKALNEYEENVNVCDGKLIEELRSMGP